MTPSFSLSQVLDWTRGRVANPNALQRAGGLAAVRVTKLAELKGSRGAGGSPSAGAGADIAFFFNPSYREQLLGARPVILVTGEPFVGPLSQSGLPLWQSTVVVACADPYGALAILSARFAAVQSSVAHPAGNAVSAEKPRIHASAVIDPQAEIGAGAQIGPHCVVEAGARIGAGSVLYASCFVGPRAVLGEDCVLFPQVVVYEDVQIGARVRIHSHTTVGSDGFGYAPERDGTRVVGHRKIYHLGRVVIGDDVEIGANCSIDRGTLGVTRIDRMAKLDNQVHIGHNAQVAEGAVLCGGTCLAGNARIGKFAYVGGLTGVVNEITVGDGAQVGALSLITRDIPPGGTGVGNPQRDQKAHFRAHAKLNVLSRKERSKKSEAPGGSE